MADRGARQEARLLAMQALYAWLHSQTPLYEVKEYLLTEREDPTAPLDREYLIHLLDEIPKTFNDIQAQIEAHTTLTKSNQLTPVEQAILTLGIYELLNEWSVPHQVIINECIELAKNFGADNSHKFINGVLDKVAKSVRPASDK